jgi:hypothetical protein
MSLKRVQQYWEELFELDTYEPATREESLRSCHWMLEQLYGAERSLYEVAVPGRCDDCGDEGLRVRIGRVDVCRRRCAMLRSAAAGRVA